MFTEELASNASRKRAEQNKARRRRQLQQQQAKKQSARTTTATSSSLAGPSAPASFTSAVNSAPESSASVSAVENKSTTATSSAASAISSATASGLVNPSIIATTTVGISGNPTQKIDAVERARQERLLRARASALQSAALRIQAWIRAVQSNTRLSSRLLKEVEQKVHDLQALKNMLMKQKQQSGSSSVTVDSNKTLSSSYVPPPATTRALVQQVLWLSYRIPYFQKRSCVRLTGDSSSSLPQLVSEVIAQTILPGLREGQKDNDETMHPLMIWLESAEGRFRLQRLLRLAVVLALTPQSSTPALDMLRALLVGSQQPKQLTQFLCSFLFLSPSSSSSQQPSVLLYDGNVPSPFVTSKLLPPPPYAFDDKPLDLISVLRFHLLFGVTRRGGSWGDPIPSHAVTAGEATCIPESHRDAAGALFHLIWQVATESSSVSTGDAAVQRRWCVRFVTEIWTVPLLTWKLSNRALTQFMSTSTSSPSSTVPFLYLLQVFGEECESTLYSINKAQATTIPMVDSLLPSDDVPLTKCPATTTQCLLANLLQLGRLCPTIQMSGDSSLLDFEAAALFFDTITVLVDAVPLGSFSSRDSVVEWVTDPHGLSKPVVLSPLVLDQCKLLLVDSFVRTWFTGSIDTDQFNTDQVLALKNDKDRKMEQELAEQGPSSATTMAAKEARIDRTRSFWNSSKWARKLSKSVTGLLSHDSKVSSSQMPSSVSKKKKGEDQGVLMDTSSMSRQLADGKLRATASTTAALNANSEDSSRRTAHRRNEYSPELFYALCRLYSVILARWGGGGNDDVVRGKAVSSSDRQKDGAGERASSNLEPCVLTLLNVLCFSTPIVRAAWGLIQSDASITSDVYMVIDADKGKEPVRTLRIRPSFRTTKGKNRRSQMTNAGAPLLFIFVTTLAHVLILIDDVEIHDLDKPLPLHQFRRCIQVLKALLHRACCIDDTSSAVQPQSFGLALIAASSKAMKDLYDRSSRQPMCVPKLWLVPDLMQKEIRRCETYRDYVLLLSSPVLRVCPFLVSFKRRLKIFDRIITLSRIEIQGENTANPFNPNPLKPGIPVRITRGRILEDGLATMNNLGPNMRQRIAVHYVNEAGVRETGIDAGGLFKEFWTDLSAVAFNPNYALFRVTDGAGNCLYPNPSSEAAHGIEHITLFAFLGRILGKAMYEGITIHPRFAHFFLSFLRGDYNFLHMLPDLSTIDPQLYSNLMFLKNYDGDAEDLCLTFTVNVDVFGGNREVNLIPNGASVDVTNANKHRYIGLVAKYYVFDRVKEQSEAFTRGLWEVIDRSWLQLFNEPELQVLISGASEGKIDVDDMRANTRYVGGFTGLDRTVNRFWNVVASMDSQQQAALLRFVTSCERPPPLGFSSMNPPFTIQRVGILRDGDQLPSASTCFNVLKLPTYSSEKVLRQRLIYAIESGAGFELT